LSYTLSDGGEPGAGSAETFIVKNKASSIASATIGKTARLAIPNTLMTRICATRVVIPKSRWNPYYVGLGMDGGYEQKEDWEKKVKVKRAHALI
jgi:hypothetical protein